ncbi:MAG: glycoside hydrolase family 92 protein [Paludibacter sp.]|nr:glycoside hydrolase family 92 protein [Paludibacter sp.]
MKNILKIVILLVIACFTSNYSCADSRVVSFVDPMIGSDYHGNVFVGASVPFGMIQPGPTNMSKGWHWCSGYHYSDSTIIGFSHTHLSGTGIGDLGDILMMPTTGEPTTFKGTFSDLTKGYVSKFSHNEEKVRPGYYAVILQKYNIKAELTATERVAYHRYTFPESAKSNIIIDLGEGIDWDEPTETYLKQIDNKTIEGYRYSRGWAKNQKIYFRAEFSKPMIFKDVYEPFYRPRSKDNIDVHKAVLSFSTIKNEVIEAKVAISYVSCANAAENLIAELSDWKFKKTVSNATKKWNKELSKIKIESKNKATQTMFYTSLFRTMFSPSIFCDVNGDYRGADGKVYNTKKFVPHTVFSLWDTYRAFHPLQTIINTKRTADWVNTLLDITDKQGSLPIWHLVGNETGTMVGVHSIPVIVDAVLKNIDGIDAERAYKLVSSFEKRNDRGLNFVRELGFIPADKENWSVSKALEYAIDDYCIALLANRLGKTEDAKRFSERAKLYKNYFDKQLGFMRGKLADGTFRKEYNPSFSLHEEADYVEGNGWQYTFLVPQDPQGLIDLFGSKKAFADKLDSLFAASSQLNEGASIDISGLIGQYAHGNEPSHSTLYLYQFVDQGYKTAEKVRQVLTEMYKPKPDGLCGNDDCGQMSAWYIFSALGFYPVNPANGEYVFGSPLVDKAVIKLSNNKTFTIIAKNNSTKNIYIQSKTLNGKPYNEIFIRHQDIMNGGELIFEMGNRPLK